MWLGSPVWFCSSIGRHGTKLRRKQGPTGGGVRDVPITVAGQGRVGIPGFAYSTDDFFLFALTREKQKNTPQKHKKTPLKAQKHTKKTEKNTKFLFSRLRVIKPLTPSRQKKLISHSTPRGMKPKKIPLWAWVYTSRCWRALSNGTAWAGFVASFRPSRVSGGGCGLPSGARSRILPQECEIRHHSTQ